MYQREYLKHRCRRLLLGRTCGRRYRGQASGLPSLNSVSWGNFSLDSAATVALSGGLSTIVDSRFSALGGAQFTDDATPASYSSLGLVFGTAGSINPRTTNLFTASDPGTLLDLSSVPDASRRVVGVQAVAALVDIIGRLDLPPMESVPDADAFDEGEIPASWRIPDTPITIARIKEGPREGEFVFSGGCQVFCVTGFKPAPDLRTESRTD